MQILFIFNIVLGIEPGDLHMKGHTPAHWGIPGMGSTAELNP